MKRSRRKGSAVVTPITDTGTLRDFCAACRSHPYVTVDTEFLRDKTYYPKLCVIQLAFPGTGEDSVSVIDAMSPTLSLDPVYELFSDPLVTKVFHSARQDLEIFFLDRQMFPEPFFDTQIAAMACGFGEQVGYETLVSRIAGANLDKSMQFTDWGARPLSSRQVRYAAADVTHLRAVYEHLRDQLAELGRTDWVAEEFRGLLKPENYDLDPGEAWTRVKVRGASGQALAVVRELARMRETLAQERDVPRNRIFSDDALMELARSRPSSIKQLGSSRLLPRPARKIPVAEAILEAIRNGLRCSPESYPVRRQEKRKNAGDKGLLDLLRVLLKAKATGAGLAPQFIATTSELEDVVAGDPDSRIFVGWRYEVFGRDALQLLKGKIALAGCDDGVRIMRTGPD